jgi:TolB protein
MFKRSLLFALVIMTCPAFAQEAAAPAPAAEPSEGGSGLSIKVGEADLKKSLMAIPPFQYNGTPNSAKGALKTGKDLYDVFRNDMEASNYFEFIKADAFLEDVSKVGLKPAPGETGGFKFDTWKQIGTEFLVRVGYRMTGDDLAVDSYVYNVGLQKLVLGKTYKAKSRDVRTTAHTFANDLIKAITGKDGFFLSKLVTSRSTKPGEKEIFVMDWDGANPQQITNLHTIAQSPTWSFDGKIVAYSAFAMHTKEKTRNLDLFTYDIATGRRFLVSYRRGINSGAAFCPDNKSLLLTISNAGNPDIYRMTLNGKSLTRISSAKNGEMNVEPAMSPDGSKIAFSSTRSGRPMIFTMNSDGSGIQQMTFAGEYNSAPAWSPDGKKLTFAGFDKNRFDIFVMDANGTNMVRLTSAKKTSGKNSNNEDPTFSPDGRSVLFRSDRTGKYQLYVVSVDGEDERRITFDSNDYFKPRWSPTFE